MHSAMTSTNTSSGSRDNQKVSIFHSLFSCKRGINTINSEWH